MNWLQRAEVFDAWRVVPRACLFSYLAFAGYQISQVVSWYMHLPFAEQSIQNAGFPTAVSMILTGLGVPIFSIYSNSGRDWNAAQAATVETTTTSKTSGPP